MKYIWQHKHWPDFTYEITPEIQDILYQYAIATNSLDVHVTQLPEQLQIETTIDSMVKEAINTSKIEGEHIDAEDVRSSIRNQLGLSIKPEIIKDPRADGIGQLMTYIKKNYDQPLTQEELFTWHRMIFYGYSKLNSEEVGRWRASKESIEIVSGPIGKETIHYEAPPGSRMPAEMNQFITWFNETAQSKNKNAIPGPVRSAIAHLYFECIHPFLDGNGRIGRALSEKILLQELQRPVIFSLSTMIQEHKKEYYRQLSSASKGSLDITEWIEYFVKTIYAAVLHSKQEIAAVVQKAQFWNRCAEQLNERQSKVFARMLKEGIDGFKGGMNAQKYMKIAHCSKATATRDLAELLAFGFIERLPGSGRNTRYKIKLR